MFVRMAVWFTKNGITIIHYFQSTFTYSPFLWAFSLYFDKDRFLDGMKNIDNDSASTDDKMGKEGNQYDSPCIEPYFFVHF